MQYVSSCMLCFTSVAFTVSPGKARGGAGMGVLPQYSLCLLISVVRIRNLNMLKMENIFQFQILDFSP